MKSFLAYTDADFLRRKAVMIYEFTQLWTCVTAGEYVPISICMFTKVIFESLPEFTNRLLGDDGFP